MNDFNVLLAAATNGAPSGSLFDALFARYIAPQESWRELESPLPIMILAAGENLIDYRIYGNTVQTGTPTPENPIMPEGVGERTENLLDKDVTKIENDKKLLADGNLDVNAYHCVSDYIPILPGTVYSVFNPNNENNVYHCFYNSNKDFLMSFPAYGQGLQTATSPANAAYIRCTLLSYVRYPEAFKVAMLIEDSTAPTSYIPYGYKLPMVSRTANLFDVKVEQGGWDAGNGTKPSKYGKEKPDFYYIRCRCDSVYAIDPEKQYTISIFPKTFQISVKQTNLTGVQIADTGWGNDWTVTGAYGICFSIRSSTNTEIIPSDIQGVTIIEGSTAPTEYIPYYRDEENIYIGSDPLAEDEYVDFGEQKIYRMANGTLTPTDPPVPIPALPTIQGETIIDYNPSETPAVEPEKMYVKYKPQ